MRTMHTLYLCSFLLILTLVYGCPSVNKSYPERTFFLFELQSPSQASTPIKGTSIDVNRFSISPSSQGREFIYRTTDLQYETDFYNQFFRPPDNIMTEAVRQYLNQSGLFEDVLSPASRAVPEYSIEGNIVELYGDYRNQSAAKAVIRLQLFLLKTSDDGSGPAILIGKTYLSEKPIGAASPNNLMNGYNLALEDILDEFSQDLSYHIQQSELQDSKNTDNSDS